MGLHVLISEMQQPHCHAIDRAAAPINVVPPIVNVITKICQRGLVPVGYVGCGEDVVISMHLLGLAGHHRDTAALFRPPYRDRDNLYFQTSFIRSRRWNWLSA
jgi:hypothetical protein